MPFDAHTNLAVSAVVTPPSPAASGTTLVVTAGEGARFPAVPFSATVWAVYELPSPLNAEVVRVTARTTDTLTITRSQEGTAARTIVVGDLIAATITAKTLTDIENAITASTGALHHATHENGGADEITVAGLSGLLADGQTPLGHHASHAPGGADALTLTAASRLFGRGSSSAGAVEELTLGDGLQLAGTVLSAPGARNSALVNYTYNSSLVEAPAAGQLRMNALHPFTAVTKLWLRFVSADGQDVYWGVMIISPGSSILVQDKDDHSKYGRFTTTALPIDKGLYAEIPVVWQDNGSAINTASQILMQSRAITTQAHHTTHETGGSDAITSLAASVITTGTIASTLLATQQKLRTITVVFGTGSAVITAGLKTYVSCPYTGTITAARLLAVDASVTSGSIVIDVWKDTYAAYPPVVGDSITASAKPTLSSAIKSDDTTLTGWTTAVTAGDVFGFTVDSASLVKQVALQLTLVVS